jgi:hypothetical protein
MAEYVLRDDEVQQDVARQLIDNAENPADVVWRPRSGVPHGGVYEVPDELAEKLLEHRKAVADADAQRIADAQAAADERDSSEGVASGLLTPAEAGFAANASGDPGGPTGKVEASGRDFDAHTLSDEEWEAKYPGEDRPDLDTGELPEDEESVGDAPADEPPAPKRTKRNRAAAAKAETPATEESK